MDRASLNKIKRDLKSDFIKEFPQFDFVGQIGSFGKVLFRVGEGDVLTPKSYSGTIGNDVTKHKNLRTPEITEFKNRKLRTINLPIKLVSSLCKVEETFDILKDVCETGKFYDLIIGNKKMGKEPFRISSFTYNCSKTDGAGNPIVLNIALSLEEYVIDIDRALNGEIEGINTDSNTLSEKVIRNINNKIDNKLKGGRLW